MGRPLNLTPLYRALGARKSPRKREAALRNGRSGGRPVVLGTIRTADGPARVSWFPGACRVGFVYLDGSRTDMPDGWQAPTAAAAFNLATRTFGRSQSTIEEYGWQPAPRIADRLARVARDP